MGPSSYKQQAHQTEPSYIVMETSQTTMDTADIHKLALELDVIQEEEEEEEEEIFFDLPEAPIDPIEINDERKYFNQSSQRYRKHKKKWYRSKQSIKNKNKEKWLLKKALKELSEETEAKLKLMKKELNKLSDEKEELQKLNNSFRSELNAISSNQKNLL